MTASAALARADQRWCRLAAGAGIRVTMSVALMLWVCRTHATHTSALALDEAAGRMPSSRPAYRMEIPFRGLF
jgi:hypothetical protein